MTTNEARPKPGSREAVEAGCKCPILDNAYGRGIYGDGDRFGYWLHENCPLHGERVEGGKR